MKKNAFTLIELLAVIVILAIISLIATPIVLNLINSSKEGTMFTNSEFYLDAVRQSIMNKGMSMGTSYNPSICEIQNDGNLLCDKKDLVEIEVKGEN